MPGSIKPSLDEFLLLEDKDKWAILYVWVNESEEDLKKIKSKIGEAATIKERVDSIFFAIGGNEHLKTTGLVDAFSQHIEDDKVWQGKSDDKFDDLKEFLSEKFNSIFAVINKLKGAYAIMLFLVVVIPVIILIRKEAVTAAPIIIHDTIPVIHYIQEDMKNPSEE